MSGFGNLASPAAIIAMNKTTSAKTIGAGSTLCA
jgi:hypothetical protein